MNCFLATDLDTDLLGTFSGEVERKKNSLETARDKCLLAMELTNAELAISNEGSFGAHPQLFFLPADEEIVFFIDRSNDLEIYVREISTATNFSGKSITDDSSLLEFAKSIGFPSHTLIAKKSKNDCTHITKDIDSWQKLHEVFIHYKKLYETVFFETDMRAMNNPTRMKVIASATTKLIDKIKSVCPDCGTPGWSVTEVIKGLPCENCRFPTKGMLKHIYQCKKCAYIESVAYPNGKQYENPMYCDICNP